jgi:STE24 endopeptidase
MGLSVALLMALWTIVVHWLNGDPGILTAGDADDWQRWESVPLMLLIGAYVFLVFGFLSRRCERQADIYGCRAVSYEAGSEAVTTGDSDLSPIGIHTFVSALNKVALINGISRRRPGVLNAWLHGTIARRVEFLERMITDPNSERHFQRRLGLLKWGLLTGLAAGLLILLAGHWEEIRPLMWAV